MKENGGDSPPTCSPSRQRGKFRLAAFLTDLHSEFVRIKFRGWRRQLFTVQRYDVAAFANCLLCTAPLSDAPGQLSKAQPPNAARPAAA